MTDSQLIIGRVKDWNLNEETHSAYTMAAPKTVQYDQVSSTVAYYGIAVVGSLLADAVWQIKKIVFTSSGGVSVTWADGNNRFDNVWNDRATLSYS